MQANNGSIILTIIICAIILFASQFYMASSIKNAIPEPEKVVVPTAAEIASLVIIPDNTEKLDEICDTVDCDGTDVSDLDTDNAIEYAASEIDEDDFLELLEDVLDIDEDDIVIVALDVKDTEVTAASEDDNEDGNLKVEGFLRIKYYDIDDDDDNEVVYVVVTADITDLYDTENDQDVEYSIRQVDRDFEF